MKKFFSWSLLFNKKTLIAVQGLRLLAKDKVKIFNNFVSLFSVVYPLTALPQIYTIWVDKKTEGMSVLTWFMWFFGSSVFLTYSLIHKEKRFSILWSAWMIMYLLIIIGIIYN